MPSKVWEDEDTEKDMDMEKLLTKQKADSIFAKIAKGLEENKIVGSANMLDYAMIRPTLHFSLAAASIRTFELLCYPLGNSAHLIERPVNLSPT